MEKSPGRPSATSFPWQETAEQLRAFAVAFPGTAADPQGRAFIVGDGGEGGDGEGTARLFPPLVLPPPRPQETIAAYARRLPREIGRQCVLLLQAGATAIGWWEEDQVVRHRASKKYVVRGHGKAQPKHQRAGGRSRQGARLRLQNWRRLLVETNETLREWWGELGQPERVFLSVPVKAWSELAEAEPPPPFARDDPRVCRIPHHVHVPDFAELCRVRRLLARGRISLPEA